MAAVLSSGASPVAAHGSTKSVAQRQETPAFSDVQKGAGTTPAASAQHAGWLAGMLKSRRSLMTLALGQIITLFTAGTGICSQYLAQEGVRLCSPKRPDVDSTLLVLQINIPTTQSTLNYALLSLHMVWVWGIRRQQKLQVSTTPLAAANHIPHSCHSGFLVEVRAHRIGRCRGKFFGCDGIPVHQHYERHAA